MRLDVAKKWPGETPREWGHTITTDAAVTAHLAAIVEGLQRPA